MTDDDERYVRILGAPAGALAVDVAVSRALSIPMEEARAFVGTLPATLPRRLGVVAVDHLLKAVRGAGGRAELTDAPAHAGQGACTTHATLEGDEGCASCGALACAVCRAVSLPGPITCGACRAKAQRKRRFFRVRVAVLLVCLFGVTLYAIRDVRSRRARNDWDHTLDVAVVLLRQGDVDPAAIAALRERLPILEDRLAVERRRYGGNTRPFKLHLVGPVDVAEVRPVAAGDGFADLLRHNWDMSRYVARIDALAGVEGKLYDTRVYVALKRPATDDRSWVEGESEQNGRVGHVSVELGDKMADFALIVVTHELFHTLGATDKYDDGGKTKRPEGLAEPQRAPLYPQPMLDVMTRNRPVGPFDEKVPESLVELGVGPVTAGEIGWGKPL